MSWQALLWLLAATLVVAQRQTMQAGHLNFLNRYLRQIWMILAIAYTAVLLHNETIERFAVSLKGTYGGQPMKAYLIAGISGAALFCGYWAIIDRVIPASASPKQDASAQKQDSKTPETKPEEKKPAYAGADQKKKDGRHKTVVQEGQGNASIEQHSEGPDSPNVVTTGPNSPVTINSPVNPNAPIVTYDFNGAKHTQTGNKFVAEVGEQFSKYQEMATLEKEQKWDKLRNEAE